MGLIIGWLVLWAKFYGTPSELLLTAAREDTTKVLFLDAGLRAMFPLTACYWIGSKFVKFCVCLYLSALFLPRILSVLIASILYYFYEGVLFILGSIAEVFLFFGRGTGGILLIRLGFYAAWNSCLVFVAFPTDFAFVLEPGAIYLRD